MVAKKIFRQKEAVARPTSNFFRSQENFLKHFYFIFGNRNDVDIYSRAAKRVTGFGPTTNDAVHHRDGGGVAAAIVAGL